MKQRLILMGADGPRAERYVYLEDSGDRVEIGRVVPRTIRTHTSDGRAQHANTWEAIDLEGTSHGDRWLTNWEAARALLRGIAAKLAKKEAN